MAETHRERPAHVVHAIITGDHHALSIMGKHGNKVRQMKRKIQQAKLKAQARENEMMYLEELRLIQLRNEMRELAEQSNEDICPVD